ncbi:MAG: phosphate ABC transporter substrate-binding protein [Firmicutes bacterium]|nr:phosphate ABC transporter substrate-binding protein [Bacillota bacterium]
MVRRKRAAWIGAIFLIIAMVLETGCGDRINDRITVISREDGSGTRGAFTELTGIAEDGIDKTTPKAEITQSTSVVMMSVAGDKNAIGYTSLGTLNDSVKTIKVDGIEITVDNIKDESYALARPFVITTKDSMGELEQDFIDFVMSRQGQEFVREEGYVPAEGDESAHGYKSKMKSKPSGRIVIAGSTSVAPVIQVLADGYKEMYEKVEIEIQQTGSSAGITSAIEGACHIGMSSRRLTEEEKSHGLKEMLLAMDGIAVIVNHENPLSTLSSEMIRRIFCGEVTTWQEVQEQIQMTGAGGDVS